MLTSLSIKNFALIETLEMDFSEGLTSITGETGAGKSLLLGALSMLLGNRADLGVVRDNNVKCVVEGTFAITNHKLTSLFNEEGLDYEDETIIRREIIPSGKSRAFINDTPVTLATLSSLGERLIDIHSQHQTLQIGEQAFQLQVLDAMASTQTELDTYHSYYTEWQRIQKQVQKLLDLQKEAKQSYDYNTFLLEELVEMKLKADEQEELETRHETLSNVEEIQDNIAAVVGILQVEEAGALDQLQMAKVALRKIASFSSDLDELANRLESVHIELSDISEDITSQIETLEANPEELERINTRLQRIYDLQKKHSVETVAELLKLQQELEDRVGQTESLDEDIRSAEEKASVLLANLETISKKIHSKRNKVLPKLTTQLQQLLSDLGMPNARFQANLIELENYTAAGHEKLELLFSANKGGQFGALNKVASGGELSRIMLAIKSILSQYRTLPTLIFDEIDTGVSGEIAQKMADMMETMSHNVQIFSITHLPQIAAKGQTHLKVYKRDTRTETLTELKQLTPEERIHEIAQMIGGAQVSDSAKAHAKVLLG